jgi:hypothetical protein
MKVMFSNGSTIHLCHLQQMKHLQTYQGAEIHILLMDELTHFAEPMYRYLRQRLRLGALQVPEYSSTGIQLKGRLPLAVSGTNPGSEGHTWVKNSFIDIAGPYAITHMDKTNGGMKRQFIPALLQDNPTQQKNDPDYADKVQGLGDPALVQAMLTGDWNAVQGSMLDDVWSPAHQVVPQFAIPPQWLVDRGYDWGDTRPWGCLVFAEANGEDVELSTGEYLCPPRGSVIVIGEAYGLKGEADEYGVVKRNVGTSESIHKQAEKIVTMLSDIGMTNRCLPGPADNAIFKGNADWEAQADLFLKAPGHFSWLRSDKSRGSRVAGLQRIRSMLRAAKEQNSEEPWLLFMEGRCLNTLITLPTLQQSDKNPDDVDSDGEDHLYDIIRYRLQKRNTMFQRVPTTGY